MKILFLLCGTIVAGVVGYFSEPSLRPMLTGIRSTPGTPSDQPSAGSDALAAAAEAGINLAELTRAQLPETVILKEETKFADKSSGLTMTVAAGSPAKLIRLEGENLAVRPGVTAYTIVVPITKTDLVEQLIANPPPAPAPPEPEPEPIVAPEPEPAVIPEEPAPIPDPEPTPEPAPEPTPEPPTAPQPAPAPAASSGRDGVVAAMQESIRSRQIKEFTFDQVLDWKPGEPETVNGEVFQSGMISYKAETIFGVKTIQAKALIKNGKVQRWIWPKSGMEIK